MCVCVCHLVVFAFYSLWGVGPTKFGAFLVVSTFHPAWKGYCRYPPTNISLAHLVRKPCSLVSSICLAPRATVAPCFWVEGTLRAHLPPGKNEDIPSHQRTWKCTNPCRKTTFLLERAFLHFHVSWWEGIHICPAVKSIPTLNQRNKHGNIVLVVKSISLKNNRRKLNTLSKGRSWVTIAAAMAAFWTLPPISANLQPSF